MNFLGILSDLGIIILDVINLWLFTEKCLVLSFGHFGHVKVWFIDFLTVYICHVWLIQTRKNVVVGNFTSSSHCIILLVSIWVHELHSNRSICHVILITLWVWKKCIWIDRLTIYCCILLALCNDTSQVILKSMLALNEPCFVDTLFITRSFQAIKCIVYFVLVFLQLRNIIFYILLVLSFNEEIFLLLIANQLFRSFI